MTLQNPPPGALLVLPFQWSGGAGLVSLRAFRSIMHTFLFSESLGLKSMTSLQERPLVKVGQ